jgi:hypothetical protein
MTSSNTMVTWFDARESVPPRGHPVAAAITGRYPAEGDTDFEHTTGEEFWLVRPMYYTPHHFSDDGVEYNDCFVDSDGVVRMPYGGDSAETVTHWAELPTLPGTTTRFVGGADVRAALQNAWDADPAT